MFDVVRGTNLTMIVNNTALTESTSSAFGRGPGEENTLYVSCGGRPVDNATHLAASVQSLNILSVLNTTDSTASNSSDDNSIGGSDGSDSSDGPESSSGKLLAPTVAGQAALLGLYASV
ncbi:uncharacterized protein Z518_00336 [Rhinocladiella mackenziei CBS 650.93]|uniref:Uncharacterized protein n=1 Tax=Rhinocladiella mackenziei CBS 650.93 TaxID=1442369 RepID=A0A0D2G3R6_9EURO|nr:uncharacterized protein Z518_00336 [Rhinocladiella mackenziei CBS 650.93]KIX09257.1 hypothetical protein Z518_00336 [Rhinocladiella mackenziei CBS 650.93]